MVNVVRSLNCVEVEVDGEVHDVGRPTLFQALTVMAAAESMRDGDGSAWREVCAVMGEWLGLRLSSLLRAGGPIVAIPALMKLLSAGMPEPERHAESEAKAKKNARQASWDEVIAEYCTAYDMAPGDVLSEPWPRFVMFYAQIDRQHARQQIRIWEAAAGAQTGKIDSMMDRADYRRQADESYQMSEETFERQMEAARAWRNRNKQAAA